MRRREKRHLNRPFPYVTLSTALNKALSTPKIKHGLNAVEIAREWEALVGAKVSAHVQPVSLNKGTLTLKTDSSVWRQQIIFMESELLDRISTRFDHLQVRDIRVI